jgi:hypothetical protein
LPHPRWSNHLLEQLGTLCCVKRALEAIPLQAIERRSATEKKEKEEKER